VQNAFIFLGAQCLIGLLILLTFNWYTVALGAASLILIVAYPFMKRITWWPQAWLGLTFNWGALIGWTAAAGTLAWPPVLLYLGGICWTLGYDTIYAHQDKEDDARIGVKSSALALGARTRPFLFAAYGAAVALWGVAGAVAGLGWAFWPLLACAVAQLAWQAAAVDTDNPGDCLAKFRANRLVGWLLFAGIIAGHFS
jgi:4-hydroxybenzoate polyprenyltransferase